MIGSPEVDGLKVRPGSFQTVHYHFINDFSAPLLAGCVLDVGNVPAGGSVLEFAKCRWVKTNRHIEDTMFPEQRNLLMQVQSFQSSCVLIQLLATKV